MCTYAEKQSLLKQLPLAILGRCQEKQQRQTTQTYGQYREHFLPDRSWPADVANIKTICQKSARNVWNCNPNLFQDL